MGGAVIHSEFVSQWQAMSFVKAQVDQGVEEFHLLLRYLRVEYNYETKKFEVDIRLVK